MTRKPEHEAIIRAALGDESSPWPTDKKYPVRGRNHEERYRAGDKQAILWAVVDCAESGEPLPPWAAETFTDLVARACEGVEFETWDEAFGMIMVSRTGAAAAQRRIENWRRVGERVLERRNAGKKDKESFWEDLHKDYFPGIGIGRLKAYWTFYRGMKRLGLA